MNKRYCELKIEVLLFQAEDIIVTSANAFDDVQEDIFTPIDDMFGN